MARGRFVGKRVSVSKKLAKLSSDSVRLLWTWGLAHVDVDGRISGEPDEFLAAVCPKLGYDTTFIEATLHELHDAGLIKWYWDGEDKVVQYVRFHDFQVGLRREKEADSDLPPYPGPTSDVLLAEPEIVWNEEHVILIPENDLEEEADEGRPSDGTGTEEVPLKDKDKGKDEDEEKSAVAVATTVITDHRRVQLEFERLFGGPLPNYPKEGAQIKKILKLAEQRWPDRDRFYSVKGMLLVFEGLHGDLGDDFWKKQPYLPSVVVSLWGRLIGEGEFRAGNHEQGRKDSGAVEEALNGIFSD